MKPKKTKKKVTGDYKTETKLNEFIGGKGFVNFISNEATIEGKYLSGLIFNHLKFKLKIYEDGSVDFDEVDTNETTTEERKRLLQVIQDQTLTSYRGRTVVNELVFTSIEKVKDKYVPLYLAVDYVKPIEKLSSLFDDSPIISNDAMDNLNNLLNSWFEDEEFKEEIQEYVSEENSQVVDNIQELINDTLMKHHDAPTNTFLQDTFSKMKEEKIKELESKKIKLEKDLSNFRHQISQLNSNLEHTEKELDLIESRIDDIQPISPTNGYYFNVSERQNDVVVLEPEISELIRDKVSKIKTINVDNFMKLFTNGEYKISISKIIDDGFDVIEDFNSLPDDIQNKLSSLDLYLVDDKFTYNGEMSWGELVNKMVKMGFQQSPEFDKFCGSNSYSSKDETKSDVKKTKTKF